MKLWTPRSEDTQEKWRWRDLLSRIVNKKLNGDEPMWDDLPPFQFVSLKPTGAGAEPALTAFTGNIELNTFAINDVYQPCTTEVTHKYKEGSDISVHLHWATQSSDGTDRTVRWEFEYTISNGSGSFASAFPTSLTLTSADITIPASTPVRSHQISSIGTIPGAALTIGAYIVGRFKRVAASAGTAPSLAPYCIALGFHVQEDTMGSRQLYTK